jgi:WD40 repeat protein
LIALASGTDDEYSSRNPFNDRIIASGSEDGKVFVWEVPKDFTLYTDAEEIIDVSPVSKLAGHSRYVETRWICSGGRKSRG